MQSIIKNIHLLTDTLTKRDIEMMEDAGMQHVRHSNITFKIVKVEPKRIIMEVRQGHSTNGHYHAKRLIGIVHETFDRFFKGWKMDIGPVPYQVPAPSQVDHAWIVEKMKSTGTRLKNISDETGVVYSYLSTLVNGAPLTDPVKAMFWYYFLTKPHKETKEA